MVPTNRIRAGPSGRPGGQTVLLLHEPPCARYRKAGNDVQQRAFPRDFHEWAKERLSPVEIEKRMRARDHWEFLNSRNEPFRRQNRKANRPSHKEAIRRLDTEPRPIRWPAILADDRPVWGFDEPARNVR